MIARRARSALGTALGGILAMLLASGPAIAGWDEGVAAWQRRDWAAAAAEFRPLAAAGNPAAQARMGQILFLGLGGLRDDAQALRLLTAAAEAGEPLAQHWLGSAYLLGRGVPKSSETALSWLGRAAESGYPESLNALGEVYFNGVGIPRDEGKGVDYYRRAADKGHAGSQEKLAELMWNGRAMPQDRAGAVQQARRAAEADRPKAQFIVGVALLTGDGADKDPAQAARWFRRAADKGHPQSARNLGALLAAGDGVRRDDNESYFWLSVAAERAPANLRATYLRERDTLGQRLSPEDLARVRARLATWRPTDGSAPMAASGEATAAPPPTASPPAAIATAPPAENRPTGRGRSLTGTGFIVAADGAVLTNAHVVEGCRSIKITPPESQPVEATLLARDGDNDLAVLRLPSWGGEIARFRGGKPPRSGDEVVVVGFPLSSLLSREANVTAGVISAMAGLRGDVRHYQITAPVQKGNSGGPLADMSGNVVGVVSAKLNAMKIAGQTGDLPQNINFAIKADLARTFLDRNGIRTEVAPVAGPPLSAADVGERIKRVTVFIQCRID